VSAAILKEINGLALQYSLGVISVHNCHLYLTAPFGAGLDKCYYTLKFSVTMNLHHTLAYMVLIPAVENE
jgi:hypothetical protein